MGKRQVLIKVTTYSEVAGLYAGVDTCKKDGKGEVGCCGEGEHIESKYAKTGLQAKFLGMRCTDKGGVREFLEGLQLKKEELCQARVNIDKKDYFSVTISVRGHNTGPLLPEHLRDPSPRILCHCEIPYVPPHC